jgi:PHD/YefM family antitoxin component YafN of YafNO toxin-antitoxin module
MHLECGHTGGKGELRGFFSDDGISGKIYCIAVRSEYDMERQHVSTFIETLFKAISDCRAKHGMVYIYVDELYHQYFSDMSVDEYESEMEKLYKLGSIELDIGCPIGRDMEFVLHPYPNDIRTTFRGLKL